MSRNDFDFILKVKGSIVLIDYTKYTVDELLDVNENINKDKYPERYKQLCDEIQRRKDRGEFIKKEHTFEDLRDNEEDDIIIEFSSNGSVIVRTIFLVGFFIVNVLVLALLLFKYTVTDISKVHKYSTIIDSVECRREEVTYSKSDRVDTYFHLNIVSFPDLFTAYRISEIKCRMLARELNIGTRVSIWHEDGLIFQLKSDTEILLSYQYMRPNIQAVQTSDSSYYLFGLFIFWIMFFKSLVNAFFPGTFTKDK